MEDELNIDPPETDYPYDDYNTEKAFNFFELEKQLEDLGFNHLILICVLRKNVMAEESQATFTK